MGDSLIINVRRQLHWQRRLVSDAGTAMLWGLWLWLFRPLYGALAGLLVAGLGVQHSILTALTLSGATSIENTALALISTAALLLLWNQMANRLSAKQGMDNVAPRTLPDYGAYFGITAAELTRCRNSQRCVVHHNEHGSIARIDLPSHLPSAEPLRKAA